MLEKLLGGQTVSLLEKAIRAAVLRHEAIASNIANVDTPGYKRVDVDFRGVFEQALRAQRQLGMAATHPAHLVPPENVAADPRFVLEGNTTFRNDGNNVDIDAEIVNLASNTIWYQSLLTALSRRFEALKMAIREGSG